MPKDLFFLQTVPQHPSCGIQCDTTGSSGSAHSSKTKATGGSVRDECETFLTTLQEIAREQNGSDLTGNGAAHTDRLPGPGFTVSQLAELGEFDQMLKGPYQGEKGQKDAFGVHMQRVFSGEKESEAIYAKLRLAGEPLNDIAKIESSQSVDKSPFAAQSENREKVELATLAAESRPVKANASENARDIASFETKNSDHSGVKDRLDSFAKAPPSIRTDIPDRMSPALENGQRCDSDNAGQSTQGQTADKVFESASWSRETEASPGTFRAQTLDQIVKKAVVHLRNGQNEANILLKPDDLGHIRMQVITENHLVTVRIRAESSFAKDMIETHIHQLKANLQQQGLDIDKLEVSISHDSGDHKHPQEKTDRLDTQQRMAGSEKADNPPQDTLSETGPPVITAISASTVDYFA